MMPLFAVAVAAAIDAFAAMLIPRFFIIYGATP